MNEMTKYEMLVSFYRELTNLRKEYFEADLAQNMSSSARDVEHYAKVKNNVAERIARFVLFPHLHMSDHTIDTIEKMLKE